MMKWNDEAEMFEMTDDGTIDWPNPHVAELFINEVNDLRKKHHLDESAIAGRFDVEVVNLRKLISSAYRVLREWQTRKALKMQEGGVSTSMIAYKLGVKESTVRLYLDQAMKAKMEEA